MGVCRGCAAAFWVCDFCDRHGEVGYCGEACKQRGREGIVRAARRRYRDSEDGQAQHRDEERDRRARRPGPPLRKTTRNASGTV
jgi:hypothetical protein